MRIPPLIYSFQRNMGPSAASAGVSEAKIASLGFNVVHHAIYDGAAVIAAADHGLRLLIDVWPGRETGAQIKRVLEQGVGGINCRRAHELSADSWHSMLTALRRDFPEAWFCAETLGRPLADSWALQGVGFDFLFSSIGWWNGSDPWFLEQQPLHSAVGRSIGFPVCEPDASPADRLTRYRMAALLSSGVMLNAGDEQGITSEIAAINRLKAAEPALGDDGELVRITSADSRAAGFVRRGGSRNAVLVALNPSDQTAIVDLDPALAAMASEVADVRELNVGTAPPLLLPGLELPPQGLRVLEGIRDLALRAPDTTPPPAGSPPSRVVIERVQPEIDGGEFPVKRIVGDQLQVTADIFRDGHDKIAARLRVSQFGEKDWAVVPLRPIANDRWGAAFPLTVVGEARYAIEAWTDHFASWADEVRKKSAAGQAVTLELVEGRALLDHAIKRASGPLSARLQACAAKLDDPTLDQPGRLALLLSRLLALWMAQAADQSDVTASPVRLVTVDRVAARFSAWYEMFPRSQGSDPQVSSTFADCMARFPAMRALGFDVVYFVPIHPIGEVNRKGRNNQPRAQPGEPGSPYAIGNRLGGHTAIDPGLGTLADFRAMVRTAADNGLEIALDFAVQCAPDHPWLKEHPDWFKRRPDGTIKYAENPPKKYEDIVNVDFDAADWRGLWVGLLRSVQFWIHEGVKIFRVDNPHTKPVAFWHWLIGTVHRRNPEVLFFAEAFTRPKMMRRLAKEGFSQSYTYFTWRTTKTELTEYLTELTQTESAEYFRPNFFPTTPDILPFHLQTGGRAMFRARLVLAATLSGAYGIYNGYELCEADGLPGKEEYRDSEKYQFKVHDWDQPGNIKEDVLLLNRLRHSSPALQLFANLRFYPSSHPEVLFYGKSTPDGRDRIFIAVTLNPNASVSTELIFPAPLGDRFVTTELFSGYRQEWDGRRHVITLNPADQPALVWKVL